MAEAETKLRRRNLVYQAALFVIPLSPPDIDRFIQKGYIGSTLTERLPYSPEVMEYVERIRQNGGKFLMPEEVYGPTK